MGFVNQQPFVPPTQMAFGGTMHQGVVPPQGHLPGMPPWPGGPPIVGSPLQCTWHSCSLPRESSTRKELSDPTYSFDSYHRLLHHACNMWALLLSRPAKTGMESSGG